MVRFAAGVRDYPFQNVQTHPAVRPASYSVSTPNISLGVRQPGRPSGQSPPSCSEVKNDWHYTSTAPSSDAFMACTRVIFTFDTATLRLKWNITPWARVTSEDGSAQLNILILIQIENEEQKCIGGQLSWIFSLLKAFTVMKPSSNLSTNQGEYSCHSPSV